MVLSSLAENLGLEPEEFSEIFELYALTTSSDMGELKAALNAGDAEKVHEKAHSIKGSSGNLGLQELYELASEIDAQASINSLDGLEKIVQVFQDKYEELVEELGPKSH